MGSTLYWEIPKTPSKTLSDAMKFLLRDRYGSDFDVVLTHGADYDWLGGVEAAGGTEVSKAATRLRDLIDKHEIVRVWESFE